LSAPADTEKRRSWLGLLLPALLAFAVLVALGTWQIERKAWKEGLIAALTERLAAPPVAIPAPNTWASLDQVTEEYRPVKFTAAFDNDKEALVYAAASAFRPDVSGRGYWAFTPARLPAGAYVMINRGFVPEARKDTASRPAGQIADPIEIVGVMRWPDPHTWFSPADDPSHNLWFARDPLAIADAKGISQAAPFYVEQESPVPPGGLPEPGKLVVRLRNEHLGYALTWYGLALVLTVSFAAWAWKSGRETRGEAPTRPSERASRSL
jgi:surfeit locus 1 family protein